jgi:hypothetical protein
MSCIFTNAHHKGCLCYQTKVDNLVRTVKKYLTVPPKTNVEATQDVEDIKNALTPLEEGEVFLAELTASHNELKSAVEAVDPRSCDTCRHTSKESGFCHSETQCGDYDEWAPRPKERA